MRKMIHQSLVGDEQYVIQLPEVGDRTQILLAACKATLCYLLPGWPKEHTLPIGSPLELIEQLKKAIAQAEK